MVARFYDILGIGEGTLQRKLNRMHLPQKYGVNPPILTQLIHLSNKLVDIAFPISKVTTLDEMFELARPPATSRVRELERPQKVRCLRDKISNSNKDPAITATNLFEIGASSDDLVDQIFHR